MPRANFTANWWPETKKLYNMIHSECMRTGARMRDLQFVFYSLTDPCLWTTDSVWKKAKFRYWVEAALVWIKIYSRLSKSEDKKSFLASFGIDEKEVDTLYWKDATRKEMYPGLAARFNKTLNKQDDIV